MRLSFVGDLFLSGSYAALPEAAQRTVFEGLVPELSGSDLVFGNFEGVVLAQEPGGLDAGKIRMPVAPAYLGAMRAAGFNVLSLSNNHVFDYGLAAFRDSRARLEAAGFAVFGAGETDDEALALVVQRVGATRVGFLGFTCHSTHPARTADGALGVALWQRPDLIDRVRAARGECDLLVVSLHWGDEHVAWPSPEQLRVSRMLIDAGADVVAGHHAHVFQGCERYRHGVVAYGLGGVTIGSLRQQVVWQGQAQDYHFEPQARHRRSVLLSVDVQDGRVCGVTVQPLQIGTDGQPRAVRGALRRLGHRAASLVWHLPGYALFYRAVLFTQFRLVPRLRWLASGRAVHSVLRRLRRA